MATSPIVIVSKRQKKVQKDLEGRGYVLVDVTSSSEDVTFRKFSPFYPHGDIPVPGNASVSMSVEGVWQALKVFEKEGVDMSKLKIKTMKNLKRAVGEKRGRVKGHAYGSEVLDYVTARKTIYIPTYQYVLEHVLQNELALLKAMFEEGQKIALVDFDVNEDVENTAKPLSHASLIKSALMS